ncbi:DUF58 domain-containing protein [Jeotgalibacillus marinus]|uniref:DUF58 domain-containing protein n=1 Tax=Jeotgalibacillus marinus TaxID=86667 RepID=A0ABV3Q8Y5_9BACL
MVKNIWNWLKEISNFLLLIVLLAGTFSYAMFQGGFVSWFLFYSFLPFGLYSVLVMLYPLDDFTVTRKIKSQDLKAGSHVTINISLKRKFPIPLFYLVMEDQVSTSIFSTKERTQVKKMIHPWFRKSIELEYEIENLPRGEHIFSGLELKTGDFLGLFQKTRSLEEKDSLLVYPSFIEMKYQPMNVRFDQGVASTEVKIQRDSTMVNGLREYQSGDRVSWIHWKSFARTNDLMTKEFEERKSHDVCVILDRTPSILFEDMVTFAASLARAVLKRGDQVGFISSGRTKQQLPVRSGENHQQQIFYQLAKVQGDSQETIEQVLEKEVSSFQQLASCLVITSKLTSPLVHQLHDFTKNNHAVAIFLVKGSNDKITVEEQRLKALASSKGIWIKECHTGHFSNVFSEVKRA